MDMDIVNSAVQMRQAQNLSKIQVAVAKKVMDVDKMNGAAALKLLAAASNTTSMAGDAMVASATGLGGEVDVYA